MLIGAHLDELNVDVYAELLRRASFACDRERRMAEGRDSSASRPRRRAINPAPEPSRQSRLNSARAKAMAEEDSNPESFPVQWFSNHRHRPPVILRVELRPEFMHFQRAWPIMIVCHRM